MVQQEAAEAAVQAELGGREVSLEEKRMKDDKVKAS